MVSVFDLEKLSGLLKDFYEITKIRITVFDSERNELVSYPEKRPPVCALIRSCSEGSAACSDCDRKACESAAKHKSLRLYRCHAGLTEAVLPLFSRNVLIGYLLFGHVMEYSDSETGAEAVISSCRDLPVPPEKLHAACLERPLMTRAYVNSAMRILQAVSYYVILEKLADIRSEALAARLTNYIETNLSGHLTADSICSELGIGRSQLYKISAGLYGRGIADQIRAMRIEQAKRLLRENPEQSIAQIASACGFSDYNYFITVFNRETGTTPGRFRKGQR